MNMDGNTLFSLMFVSAFFLQPRGDQEEEEEKERYGCASPILFEPISKIHNQFLGELYPFYKILLGLK